MTEPSIRQQHEIEYFRQKHAASWLHEVNLDWFSKPQFGPWDPYWRVFDFALTRCPPPGPKLLDYGCGRGKSTVCYAHRGYDVEGFDISETGVENARQLAMKYGLQDRMRVAVMSAEKLDYPSETFDIIVGQNILHHIDLPRAVPEMVRVLKPGGVAVFKDSLHTPVKNFLRNSWIGKLILPKGVKNLRTGERMTPTPDEHPLRQSEINVLRQHFSSVRIERFHVLAQLERFFGNRHGLQKVDWKLFRILPFVRRLGDQIVVILEK